MVPEKVNLDNLIHQLTEDMGNPHILKLGSVAVAPDHLAFKRLHKHLKSIPPKRIPDMIAGYAHPQGDTLIRHQSSNLLFLIIPSVSMEDIIVTNGCTEALSLSLKAVSNPGDTIIVESPTDPWLRQIIKDSDLYALEVPTDPDTGIDLSSVKRIIRNEKIAACIVNPNCQNPLGFLMPDDHKKEFLDLLGGNEIPIIENDICGELYFGEYRPTPLKKWDVKLRIPYTPSEDPSQHVLAGEILSPGTTEEVARMIWDFILLKYNVRFYLTATQWVCDDIDQHCSGVAVGEGRLLACIEKNDKKVSSRCKDALKEVGLKE